jgi:hypothetical protein
MLRSLVHSLALIALSDLFAGAASRAGILPA